VDGRSSANRKSTVTVEQQSPSDGKGRLNESPIGKVLRNPLITIYLRVRLLVIIPVTNTYPRRLSHVNRKVEIIPETCVNHT
jgi:hypothetical protein